MKRASTKRGTGELVSLFLFNGMNLIMVGGFRVTDKYECNEFPPNYCDAELRQMIRDDVFLFFFISLEFAWLFQVQRPKLR